MQTDPVAANDAAQRRRSIGTALAILAALLLLGLSAAWFVRPDSDESRYTAEERADYLSSKDVGIGQLENFELAAADATFLRLTQVLPNERLPVRNLAITRLLQLQASNESDVEPVEEAVNRMLEYEQDSSASIWLQSQMLLNPRVADPSAERDLQVQQRLSSAAEKSPKNPVYWYAIYDVGSISSDAMAQANGLIALKEAWKLQRDNIWVLTELLYVQAKNKDPEITETLDVAGEALAPLEAMIQRGANGAGAKQYVEQAATAASANDWTGVFQSIFRLKNAVRKTEVSKRDLALVQPHPLEMIVVEFESPELQTRPPKSLRDKADNGSSQTSVSFAKKWSQFPMDAGENVVAIQFADFDLDGSTDLIAVTDKRLLVLTQHDETWQASLEVDIPPGARGFALGDMDRDRQVLKTTSQTNGESQAAPPTLEQVASQPAPVTDRPNDDASALQELPPSKQIPLSLATDEPPRVACHEADLDLVVYGQFGVMVFRNTSSHEGPSVELVAQQDELVASVSDVASVAMVDVDHDSDLDLIVGAADGMRVWSLVGASMQYEDISQWSTLPKPPFEAGAIAIVDWNRDVAIDAIVSSKSGDTVGILENIRHGRFLWRPFKSDENWKGGATLAITDADANVSWDVLAAGTDGVRRLPSATNAMGIVAERPAQIIDTAAASGGVMLDFNNSGQMDFVAWRDKSLRFYRGAADGSLAIAKNLSETTSKAVTAPILAVAAGDIDGDGDLDLALATGSGIQCLENRGGNSNHWITVQAMGTADNAGRANHTGIGSLIELKCAGQYQAQVVTSQATHFGLGATETPDVIRIIWPNGVPQAVIHPSTDLALCEPMELKGSCPYVYTWNGERYEFHTDCLWAAPIGLQVADGVVAPSRAWEYLKIPGERLVADAEGYYKLQLTEELWEIAYFDQVELLVVDHPEDVAIYSNEKVGPAEIAAFQIHTVAKPRQPIAATDQRGRDVSERLAKRDGDFLRAFDQRIRQGLTTPHYMELDLGDLKSPQQITLFLTGWIYPTDTSLNIAFSQDPDTKGPQAPSVWTPNADGSWRKANAFMGFPGGKTKTIAIDLSQAFAAKDYRVRIATTAEIYWDEAFFTVDEEVAPLQVRRLQPTSADLHYRGVSRRRWHKPNAPEQFDYDLLQTAPVWPPVRGKFTRYGNVAPLLTAADDRLAVLGTGDEMTVRFKALPPPKAGWRRDFLLHCVGWDKDADLNTFHGHTVEPLPFRDMTTYPYAPESFPDSPQHQQYLKEYQTRQQDRRVFWKWTRDVETD